MKISIVNKIILYLFIYYNPHNEDELITEDNIVWFTGEKKNKLVHLLMFKSKTFVYITHIAHFGPSGFQVRGT